MTTDDQVDTIIRMMLRGEWKGMKSRAELSEKWGIHEHTVGLRAQAASTFLRKQCTDIELEAREALAELDALKRMALEYQHVGVTMNGETISIPQPNIKEARECIKLKMDILGITTRRSDRNSRQKPDVDDRYANASREERIAMLKQAIAEEEASGKDGMH